MKLKLVIIAMLFLLCSIASSAQSHQVVLNWTASTTTTVTGYNVYRLTGTCPSAPSLTSFTKLNTAEVTVLTFTDTTPAAATTYCYTVTAVAPSAESGIGALALVTIPSVTAVLQTNPPASMGVGSVQ